MSLLDDFEAVLSGRRVHTNAAQVAKLKVAVDEMAPAAVMLPDPEGEMARGPRFQAFLQDRSDQTEGASLFDARLAWPESWFRQNEVGDVQACQKLWGSILFECVYSMLKMQVNFKTTGYRGVSNTDAPSFSWLGSVDFVTVCDMAGLDRGYALRLADELRAIQSEVDRMRSIIEAMKGGASRATDNTAA